MRLKKLPAFIACFFLMASIVLIPDLKVKAATTSRVYYTVDSNITVGQEFNIYVNAENISDLYGAAIDLKYDTSMIKVTSAKVGTAYDGLVSTSSTTSSSGADYFTMNSIDQTNGVVSIAATILGNTHATGLNITTGKSLFVIKATALKAGTLNLNFVNTSPVLTTGAVNTQVKLSDSAGGNISASSATISTAINTIAVNSFTTDKASPQAANTAITLSATASGTTQPLYQFWANIGTSWVLIKDYSTSNTCTWTPSAPGTYTLYVNMKDKLSTNKYDDFKTITYVVNNAPKVASFTTDKTSPQAANTAINLTATASGTAQPLYQFWANIGTSWILIKDYSTSNTCTWTPSTPGTYTLYVNMKDKLSTNKYDDFKTITYVVNNPVKVSSFTTDKASPQAANTAINLTAAASGTTQPLYQFWANIGTSWILIKDYSTSNTCTWTPSTPGTYTLYVNMKDKLSTNKYDDFKTITYVVNNAATVSSFTTDKASPQAVNTAITLSATASGTTQPLYQFWANIGTSWILIKDYSTSNTCTWTPSAPGTYTLYVNMKDTLSANKYDDFKTITYVVGNTAKVVSFTTDKTSPQATNTAITLSAAASGTTQALYQFWAYNGTTWVLIKDYSTSSTCTWTPSAPGTYTLYVNMKDKLSTNKYDDFKTITYQVN